MPAGTVIGTFTVTMSDASPFAGNLALSGSYASLFAITKTRDPYSISSVILDHNTIAEGSGAGAVVGTFTVTLSDASVFSGSLSVDDIAHFSIAGMVLSEVSSLTAATYPIRVTATDPGSTNGSLTAPISIVVQPSSGAMPGPPTSFRSVSETTSSVTLSVSVPTTGAALDYGSWHIEQKPASGNTWSVALSMPYSTASGNSSNVVTDAYGNVWTVTVDGVININGVVDAASYQVTGLLLVGGVMWQSTSYGEWWSCTPSGRITDPATLSWSATGTTVSPLTTIVVSGLSSATSYNYRASVSNSAGWSLPSATITVSTL